jgi:uncharacterized membrane protein HdeD (DUF308 family)
VVSGVWDRIAAARYRIAAARYRGRCPVGYGHGRYDALFRVAPHHASAIEVIQAVMVGHWVGFFHHLLAAILFGVIGVMLIARPLISAEALTVVMAVFFLIGGLFQLIASVAVALPGWGWATADGIIMLVLGGLILAQWPASGLWVIGLFVGIDLIFYGFAWIALAAGLRTA